MLENLNFREVNFLIVHDDITSYCPYPRTGLDLLAAVDVNYTCIMFVRFLQVCGQPPISGMYKRGVPLHF